MKRISGMLLSFVVWTATAVAATPIDGYGLREFRAPLTVEALREVGRLRVGVKPGTLSFLVRRGVVRGFETELLRDFARNSLRVRLDLRPIATDESLLDAVHDRRIDVAVLPWSDVQVDGAIRAAPALPGRLVGDPGTPSHPATGAIFVRSDAPELLAELDAFLVHSRRNGRTQILFDRYFRGDRYRRLVGHAPRISPWDDTIAAAAERADLDWRFVAAVMVEESRLDPTAVSHKGARGLMQLMPAVLRENGGADAATPEGNIRAGVRHLERLASLFPDSPPRDRLALALASYLMGPGHVSDARAIARDLGLDPHRWWGGVDQVVSLLEETTYANEARHGFARGSLAVDYVNSIFRRYRLFESLVGPEPRRET